MSDPLKQQQTKLSPDSSTRSQRNSPSSPNDEQDGSLRLGRPAVGALLRSLRYMGPYRGRVLASLLCLLASSAGNLAVPRITQQVIDSGILVERMQAI